MSGAAQQHRGVYRRGPYSAKSGVPLFCALLLALFLSACVSQAESTPQPTALSGPEAIALVKAWLTETDYGDILDCMDYHSLTSKGDFTASQGSYADNVMSERADALRRLAPGTYTGPWLVKHETSRGNFQWEVYPGSSLVNSMVSPNALC